MSTPVNTALARQARELFVQQAGVVLTELAGKMGGRLGELFDKSANAREAQDRRDVIQVYQKNQKNWVQATIDAWKRAAMPPSATQRNRALGINFELMGNELVENKILSSRLSLRILDKCSWEFNDLSLRIRALDGVQELERTDVLRPEAIAQLMVEQWFAAGMTRDAWLGTQDLIHQIMGERLVEAYHKVNELLMERRVMPEIDLRQLVKRTPGATGAGGAGGSTASAPLSSQSPLESTQNMHMPTQPVNYSTMAAPYMTTVPGTGGIAPEQGAVAAASNALQAARAALLGGAGARPAAMSAGQQPGMPPGARSMSPGRAAVAEMMAGGEETRMMTSATPLSRARMRAQGVMGQLKRFISQKVAGFESSSRMGVAPSPGLAAAMAGYATYYAGGGGAAVAGGSTSAGLIATRQGSGTVAVSLHQINGVNIVPVVEGMAPEKVSEALKEQTKEVKKAASTDAEKATVEIVALMFQAILAEDRIPSGIRVWFARLQMPVLRLALAEPEFFESLQHPARRLIDRMGAVVLGFEGEVSSIELETEIKRIVQVIEQYPETGRRVFQLVYDEFQKFLSKFLTNKGSAQKIISVAQQVEEKEAAAIQYTIELRKMLGNVPMRDEIREFLFKIWAEVLAVASVKDGAQSTGTLNLKQAAVDLVWAASAKPSRQERAKVIEDLPGLLKRLRQGMDKLGLTAKQQDEQIKIISDTLAAAFMSKSQATVDQKQIDDIAKRLRNLEDFISEDDVGDLPLDPESIELMLGIDLADIDIITKGGTDPNQAMRAWAMELEVGSWFTLDHNGKPTKVQYSWRSDKGQLHLFASTAKHTYLFQLRRFAAYLQAGLLVPVEEETLTVRATRAAMSKLDANPERLLAVS